MAGAQVTREAVEVTETALVHDLGETVAFVRDHRAGPLIVVIDARLIVPNETGRRTCERELQRRFGRPSAGPYPANRQTLTRFHGARRGEQRVAHLEKALCDYNDDTDSAKEDHVAKRSRLTSRSVGSTFQPPVHPHPPAAPALPTKPSAQPIVGWSNPTTTNVWIPVDAYLVRHYGWQTADVSGCMASIICYSSGVLVGYVNFFNADHVPQSTINASSPPQLVLTINYPVERVQEVLDTLRLETPIHIGVDLGQRIGWVGMNGASVGHVSR